MEDPDYKHLQSVRAGHKGHVTRLMGKVEQFFTDEASINDEVLDEIEMCLKLVNQHFSTVVDLSNQLREFDLGDSFESLLNQDLSYEDEIKFNIMKTERKIKKFRAVPPLDVNSTLNATNNVNSLLEPVASVKLPYLNIPVFDGSEPALFTFFWDSFDALIHSNDNLAPVTKFNYLMERLRGEALFKLRGFKPNNDDYLEAVRILKRDYGNKESIVENLMNKLSNLSLVKHDRSNLRRFYDDLECTVRSLKSYNINYENYQAMLIPQLRKKLPYSLMLSLEERRPDAGWDLDSLLKGLRSLIEARERCGVPKGETSFNPNDFNKPQTRSNPPKFGTLSNVSNSSGGTVPHFSQCTFCEQSHKSVNCHLSYADKIQVLRTQRRCFVCLGRKHFSKQCMRNFTCIYCKSKNHNSAICKDKFDKSASGKSEANANTASIRPQESQTASKSDTVSISKVNSSVVLQTAYVTASSSSTFSTQPARMLFDTGASRSFVTESLAKCLGLKSIGQMSLSINTFGSYKTINKNVDIVEVLLSKGSHEYVLEACVVPIVCNPLSRVNQFTVQELRALENFSLADRNSLSCGSHSIDILIGSDQYWSIVQGPPIHVSNSSLIVTNSLFGYLVSGPQEGIENSCFNTCCFLSNDLSPKDRELNSLVEHYFSLDSFGTEIPEKDDDSLVVDFFKSNLARNGDGRYVSRFLYKENLYDQLPDNFNHSKHKLNYLYKNLTCNDQLVAYDSVIQEQLDAGIVEIVESPDEIVGNLHYLSHHPVFKASSETTKLRVVYNGSFKSSKKVPSLNDVLYQGPNILASLLRNLLGFRFYNKAIIGDIQKAYLQIELDRRDRDVTRFIWLKDITKPLSDSNIVILRFCRVLFGLIVSQFILLFVLSAHFKLYHGTSYDALVRKLERSFYVDDLSSGVDSIEEGKRFYIDSKKVLSEAKFPLVKWYTNDSVLQTFFDSQEGHCSPSDSIQTVLGVGYQSRLFIV